jgi:RimJ/RimL family protein N-acetyltransferase
MMQNGAKADLNNYHLRKFIMDDCDALVHHLTNTNITKYLSRVPDSYNHANAEQYITGQIEADDSFNPHTFNRAIILDKRLVGCVGFTLNHDKKSGELGYWLAEECWGRGIMTRAAREMVDEGFSKLRLQTIHASTKAENQGSQKVLKKLGFNYVGEGTVRNCNGDISPVYEYILSNPH